MIGQALIDCEAPPDPPQPFFARVSSSLVRILLYTESALLWLLEHLNSKHQWRMAGLSLRTGDLASLFSEQLTCTPDQAANNHTIDVILYSAESQTAVLRKAFPAAELLLIQIMPGIHDDARSVGLAEVLRGQNQTCFRILRCRSRLTTAEVLFDGRNRTKLMFSLNQAALWSRINSVLINYLSLRHRCPVLSAGEHQTEPRSTVPALAKTRDLAISEVLSYPAIRLRSIARIARQRRDKSRQWSVAVFCLSANGQSPNELTSIDLQRSVQFIECPNDCFYADPFLWPDEHGVLHCFVEDYVYATGRAHISVLRESDIGWERIGTALSEAFHLSFPYLFEFEGQLYMCPESADANSIRIYRCHSFPLQWELVAEPMPGQGAADTVLFEHGDRWWMLTSLDQGDAPDYQAELHVFHAPSPLSTHWTALPNNPVKIDSLGARNGGFFSRNGDLFRCGQLQSMNAYGSGLSIYQITRLDEHGYEETPITTLNAPADWQASGIHTLSIHGQRGVIDLLGALPATRALAR